MLLRRLQNGAVTLVGVFLPTVVACAIIVGIRAARHPPRNQGWTPNPAPAPWYFFGPTDLLVYLDPWFAGTISFWLNLWLGALGLFVLGVLLWWPTEPLPPRRRRLGVLMILSLTLGLAFAGPWVYALICFAWQNRTTP